LASGSLDALRPGAWNTVTLGSNPTLHSGTPYWVAVLGIGGQIDFRDRSTGHCSQSNATTLTDLPPTWSPGTSWPTCSLSAYVSAATSDTAARSASKTTGQLTRARSRRLVLSGPRRQASVFGKTFTFG
jgi:hypothetical protein